MSQNLDQAQAVRPGEELPSDALAAYLRSQMADWQGPIEIEQFPHGHSNLTYLVRNGERALVLRRPPFGNVVKTAHDVGREYRVLSRLSAVYPLAPRPVLHCQEESILGAPFYLMERREGFVLRRSPPAGVELAPDVLRRLGLAMIDNLAALHALDFRAAGLGDLGKPEGYVQRQVSGWIGRYQQARTSEVPPLERVMAWLSANVPQESGAALIHNDFKFDNLILDPGDPTRIVAVLDWEMATVGDPWMDLGTTLGYWVEACDPEALQAVATGPTFLPGNLTRRELVARYGERTGRAVSNPLFYYCFGLFKIAVIVQQIFARYVRGHTRDPRFAHLDRFVAALADQAARKLDDGAL